MSYTHDSSGDKTDLDPDQHSSVHELHFMTRQETSTRPISIQTSHPRLLRRLPQGRSRFRQQTTQTCSEMRDDREQTEKWATVWNSVSPKWQSMMAPNLKLITLKQEEGRVPYPIQCLSCPPTAKMWSQTFTQSKHNMLPVNQRYPRAVSVSRMNGST